MTTLLYVHELQNPHESVQSRPTEKVREMFGDFDEDLSIDCDSIDEIARTAHAIRRIRDGLNTPEARRILQLRNDLEAAHDGYVIMVDDVARRLQLRPEWHKRALRPVFEATKLAIDDGDEDF
ncbi:hypothetical protein N7516_001376 [Penicillium verrucosum]|uniref:uncharacterized protein n=1 Tax=Penicillium verrucosum TaxID=60171 RepID=UPI0025456694|nr:uncharacterized protein N7516_001376 [Penicillium verrucosum]KAJ5941208.1 hypothetical protein N7516_001376 [Penicillium verrucosum]